MRALALAVLVACGGEPVPVPIALSGEAPAIDALIAAVKSGSLARLDAIIAEPIGVPLHHAAMPRLFAGAKDRVAGVDARGGVTVWDAKTARPIAHYQPATVADAIAISADGERLALRAGDRGQEIDLATGFVHGPTVAPPEVPPRWLPTARGLVDPATDKPVLAIPDAVAAFGESLVTSRGELWTFAGILIGHSDAIVSIVPRGDRLLTASRDGLAIVWKNSAIQHALPRASSPLVGAGFVTETRIAVGAADGAIEIYDLDSSTVLASYKYDGLACLAVTPDGRVAVATTAGQLESRDVALAHPTPLAASPCQRMPPTVTVGEWRITGDASGALRLHPTSLPGAIARACGILRRFDRADGVCTEN